MIELTVENYLKREARSRGGWAIKLIPWADAGLPDRLVVLPVRRIYFVELKSETGKLRPAQRMVRRKLGLMGWEVFVLKSKTEIDEWFIHIEEN